MAFTQQSTLNPYEEARLKLERSGNPYYSLSSWNRAANTGTLDAYLLTAQQLGKDKETYDNFAKTYELKYLSDEYKDFAGWNELTANREKITHATDANGKEMDISGKDEETLKQMEGVKLYTDYDWGKLLLSEKVQQEKDRLAAQALKESQAAQGWLGKMASYLERVGRETVSGFANTLGDVYNIFDGIIQGSTTLINEGDFGKGWRNAKAINEMTELISDPLRELMFDWEQKYGHCDYYGNETHLASFIGGLANSFGRMIPSIFAGKIGGRIIETKYANDAMKSASAMTKLGKTTQGVFYLSAAENNITEMLNDPETASLSNWSILSNSLIKEAFELAIENSLVDIFGRSMSDQFFYGFNATKISGLGAKGSVLLNITKSAFQEGLEELLQDYSRYFTDKLFSTWYDAIGNDEFADIYNKKAVWNMQTAVDAFLSGFLMSVIGSTFHLVTTRRVQTLDAKTDRQGNIVYDKKGNIVYKKFSQLESYNYKQVLQTLGNDVKKLMSDKTISKEERTNIAGGLYTSLRSLSDIFNGIGEERMNNVFMMLSALSKSDWTPVEYNNMVAKEINEFASTLEHEYNIKKSAELEQKLKDLAIRNAETTYSINDTNEDSNTTKAKDMISKIKDADTLIVTKDGHGPALVEDKGRRLLIVPKAGFENWNTDYILKDLSEQRLIKEIIKEPRFKVVVKNIFDLYKRMQYDKGIKNKMYSETEAIAALFTDKTFATNCIFEYDKTMIDFISKLTTIVYDGIKDVDVYDSTYGLFVKNGIKDLTNLMVDLYKVLPFANYQTTNIFTNEQKQEIYSARYSFDMVSRLSDGGKLTQQDLKLLKLRTNASTLSDEVKADIIRKFENWSSNPKAAKIALNTLAENQYGMWYSKFDDITYPKLDNVNSYRLYNFLTSYGITIQNITKGRQTLVRDGQTVSKKEYYKKAFEEYTSFNLTLEYTNDNKIVVKELTPLQIIENESGWSNDKFGRPSENQKVPNDYISDAVSSNVRDVITINDLIQDTSLLSDTLRDDILNNYKVLSPDNVYKYLKSVTLNESNGLRGIGVMQDGSYVYTDVENASDMLSEKSNSNINKIANLVEKAINGDEDAKQKLENGYKISEFIDNKYLGRREDKDVIVSIDAVRQDKGFNGNQQIGNAHYEENSNVIILHYKELVELSKKDKQTLANGIRNLILHEFRHALQKHNGLNTGFVIPFKQAFKDSKSKNAIIKDVERHASELLKGVKNKEDYIANMIYRGTGEADAYGVSYEVRNNYPTFIVDTMYKNSSEYIKIVTPWGSTYSIGIDGPDTNKIEVKTTEQVTQAKQIENIQKKSLSTNEYDDDELYPSVYDAYEIYSVNKDSEIDVNQIEELFYDMNTSKDNQRLADIVFGTIKKYSIPITFEFTNNIDKKDAGTFSLSLLSVKYNYNFMTSDYVYESAKAEVILHEAVHAVTVFGISLGYRFYVNDLQSQYVNQFKDIKDKQKYINMYLSVKEVLNELQKDENFKGQYGLTNEYEAIAELTDDIFSNKLKNKNLIQRIVDAILNFFGIKPSNAYDALRISLVDIITKTDYDVMLKSFQYGSADLGNYYKDKENTSQAKEIDKTKYIEQQRQRLKEQSIKHATLKEETYRVSKREAGDNKALQAVVGKHVHPRVKQLLRGIGNRLDGFDSSFVETVNNGQLRTVNQVYDYVIKNNISEPLFDVLNRYFFKNTNIKSSKELTKFSEMSKSFYALRAALRSIAEREGVDISQYLHKVGNIYDIYNDALELVKSYDYAENLFNQVKNRYETTPGENINYGRLKLKMLLNYDGTLYSLAKEAANEKLIVHNPKIKRVGDKQTTSFDAPIDSKGENLTVGDTLAQTNAAANEFANAILENIDTDIDYIADEEIKQKAIELVENELVKYYNSNEFKSSTPEQTLKTVEEIAERISKYSDNKILLEYEVMTQSQINNIPEENVRDIVKTTLQERIKRQQNIQQRAKRILSHIKGKLALQTLIKNHPNAGFSEDGTWHTPTNNGVAYRSSDFVKLNEEFDTIWSEIRNDLYQVRKVQKLKEELAKVKKQNERTKIELERVRQEKRKERIITKTEFVHLDDTTFEFESSKPMPETFKNLLNIVFKRLAKTKGKFTNINEMHTVKNYQEWIDTNAETLSQLTEVEATEILEYILNAEPIFGKYGGDDMLQYEVVKMFTYSYIYRMSELGVLNIDPILLQRIEDKHKVQTSTSATLLSVSKQVMKEADPITRQANALAAKYDIVFKESDVANLKHAVEDYSSSTEQNINKNFKKVKDAYDTMYRNALEQYKGNKRSLLDKAWKLQRAAMLSSPGTWVRNLTSNALIKVMNPATAAIGEKIFGKLNKIADKAQGIIKRKVTKPADFDITTNDLSFAEHYYGFDVTNYDEQETRSLIRKLSDLAYKAKGIKRNETLANEYIQKSNNINNKLSTVNETERVKYKSQMLSYQESSYMYSNPEQFVKDVENSINALEEFTKYSREISKYNKLIGKNPIRKTMEGQYKIVGTKVDENTKNFIQRYIIDNKFLEMIQDGLSRYGMQRITGTDSDSKIVGMIKKSVLNKVIGTNQFDTKALNKLSNALFKVLSDDKFVTKSFVVYLGKILVEDKVDLTKGLSSEVLDHVVDAYTIAAYDYMHTSNFMNAIEKIVHDRLGKAGFFMYKQILPFAAASTNWFMEFLRYSPLGMAKAIKDFWQMEKYIAKLDRRNAQGEGPSSRFGAYLIKRNLGKGAIGTALWLLGALLAGFGVLHFEEDDDGIPKFKIGDVYIDISDVYGTSGFTWGAVMGSAIYSDDMDFLDVLKVTLDQMFEDSIYTDIADIFEYSDSFSELLINSSENILTSFVPNILKTFTSMMYNGKVKYSTGMQGYLERIAIQTIPGLAYAMPKKYDIYTGEQQYKYFPSFWGWLAGGVSKFSPVKIHPRKISNLEKEAISQGVSKALLTGRYDDIGNFNSKQVGLLNETYGKLNNSSLPLLYNNKKRYRVLDKKKNKYVELLYSQMDKEQKESVIKRIMSDNAKYSKIYVWTNDGHKYYATSSEYKELIANGIRKNIYVAKQSKFVK